MSTFVKTCWRVTRSDHFPPPHSPGLPAKEKPRLNIVNKCCGSIFQFYLWYNLVFSLFWCMIIYESKTREIPNRTKGRIEPQHIQSVVFHTSFLLTNERKGIWAPLIVPLICPQVASMQAISKFNTPLTDAVWLSTEPLLKCELGTIQPFKDMLSL